MTLQENSCTRVLVADAHPLLLRGVQHLLRHEPDLSIIGEAISGAQALRLASDLQPDIAILDVALPGLHGSEIRQRLAERAAGTRVIILSGTEEPICAQRALAAGVCGYVLKRSAPETLLHAIRAVRTGGLYLDPTIAGQLVPAGGPPATRTSGIDGFSASLTNREREVIRLIALGFTNKEIAGKLGITAKSIETYRTRASEKLDIRTRAKIVQYAMAQGWFRTESGSSVPEA
ncbi:response regulator [Methylobacterium nodulans]|uniref:Two component transcriptional regulator, LuxR family n=1 Tax=Methylobacterium nodulans (strain LMG 21967 / CNCM I-2342 / ORS 2060) TaxID=460265 RepID=B8IGH6_METNO|nr:response regulator transcription factor [Methylobacterium nodulans]ACL55876.1 two component transcriptional regulator, LuxR family [Methylobacterium nodulans ORS 2060]